MERELERLREETQSRPQNIHPSAYVPLESKAAPDWAMQEFMEMPYGLIAEATSKVRGPLIPARFGTKLYPLDRAYFSVLNRDHLMDKIMEVMLTRHRIQLTKRQSDESLLQLMNAVWDDCVSDLSQGSDTSSQRLLAAVAALDAIVLGRAIENMIVEYRNFLKDRKFFEKNPYYVNDIPPPLHTSIKNEHPLPPQPAFLVSQPPARPPGTSDLNLIDVGRWPQ